MDEIKKLQLELEQLIGANKKKSLFPNDAVVKAHRVVIKDMIQKKGETRTIAYINEVIEGYRSGRLPVEYS